MSSLDSQLWISGFSIIIFATLYFRVRTYLKEEFKKVFLVNILYIFLIFIFFVQNILNSQYHFIQNKIIVLSVTVVYIVLLLILFGVDLKFRKDLKIEK